MKELTFYQGTEFRDIPEFSDLWIHVKDPRETELRPEYFMYATFENERFCVNKYDENGDVVDSVPIEDVEVLRFVILPQTE